MEIQKKIAEMNSGDKVEGFYLLRSAAIKTATSGKQYLAAVLSDCSGDIDTKAWDYTDPEIEKETGSIVKVRGDVTDYKGIPQFTIQRLRKTTESDDIPLSEILPTAPIDKDATVAFIEDTISEMSDPDFKSVCETMFRKHYDQFTTIPAGKSVHHSFLSGLLMHTSNMMRIAASLCQIYEGSLNSSLLMAGTFLHDFAKIDEFVLAPSGIVTDYSVKGQLLGHLVLGAEEVGRVCDELNVPEEKKILLQHMILSHHGEPEFGAAVRPHCIESELLSYIDIIDSRVEIYTETFKNMIPGTFSSKVYALDKKIYYHVDP